MKNFTLFSFFLLLAFSFLACGENQEPTATTTPKVVKVNASPTTPKVGIEKSDLDILEITKADQKRTNSISGRVIPKNTTQLFAEVQGRILPESISFKPGVAFKKGDPLLYIDKKEFELNLEAQRSSFFNALTNIMPDMKSDYPENYDNWLNYIQSYQFGRSLPPLPETKSDKEKYYVTTYQIYSQYYTIKAQEDRLRKFTIFAPYSGIITQSNIDVGSMVSPAQPLGTIINRYSYELEAGIDLKTASNLNYGDVLTFTSNDIKGSWTGKVVRKNKIVDPTTQNIPIYFQLTGKNIQAGMYLEGNYDLKAYKDVTTLPMKAVKRDESVLYVNDGIIASQKVEVVDYLTDAVVVKGLKDGTVVILNNFETPVVGQKIIE